MWRGGIIKETGAALGSGILLYAIGFVEVFCFDCSPHYKAVVMVCRYYLQHACQSWLETGGIEEIHCIYSPTTNIWWCVQSINFTFKSDGDDDTLTPRVHPAGWVASTYLPYRGPSAKQPEGKLLITAVNKIISSSIFVLGKIIS